MKYDEARKKDFLHPLVQRVHADAGIRDRDTYPPTDGDIIAVQRMGDRDEVRFEPDHHEDEL